MPIIRTTRFLLRKTERFLIYRVLSLRDTPHRIALGVAIGMFIAWTPSMPLQMVLTFSLCWLLRANLFVGVPFVWLSNPLTILPVYGPNLLLGQWILGKPVGNFSPLYDAVQFSGGFVESAKVWWNAIRPIFGELWVGSLVVGLVVGTSSYFVIYRLVIAYRLRRHRRHPEYYAEENE